MKILYIETTLSGHHFLYLQKLIINTDHESVLVLPEKIDEFKVKQYIINDISKSTRRIYLYYILIKQLYNIVQNENPDIIHFLYGDVFYRFFGIGLFFFRKYNTIITFHHLKKSKIRYLSMKIICKQICYGVVHTDSIYQELRQQSIFNLSHIEYPNLSSITKKDKNEVLKKLGLPYETPILAALGGTREDKGLDILLEALSCINIPFHLLIAGKEDYFDRKFIQDKVVEYKDNVTLILDSLSDEMWELCLNAADIIVLPYRSYFNGASGPLGEGVWLKKVIIGPNHGSLGDIIQTNHIGYTFESENISSLVYVLQHALLNDFEWDKKAEDYRISLASDKFYTEYLKLYNKTLTSVR